MEKLNLKNILNRLTAETPKFWKKIRNIMVSCGGAGLLLQHAPAESAPYIPMQLPGIMITLGLVGTLLAQMTVKGQDEDRKDRDGSSNQ